MKSDTPNLIPIKDPREIGALIRQARKQAILKQAEAAAMCRVGTRFLSDLENGKPTLHLGKTLQVLKAFGLVVLIKKKELTDD